MNRYCFVPSHASGGTRIARQSISTDEAMTTVSTAAISPNRQRLVAIVSETSRRRRAPNNCPIMTVPPVVRPIHKLVTVCITWLPVATADTAAGSAYRPTMNKSTAP